MVNTPQQESKKPANASSGTPKPTGVKKLRKARRQVEQRKNINLQREEGTGEYNIWYHKFLGQGRQREKENETAATRCNIKKDSGWTLGCTEKEPYFCLFFARGCCSSGPDCRYLHRIPVGVDHSRIPITKDCFGRDKHAKDREDMGGVGSFNRDSRTLYISNLKNIATSDMEEVLTRHFKEWGELEYVRPFPERCYAFLKYKNRLNAEFAKEAMMNQPLDNGEVIHIKWATDDSNPLSTMKNQLELRSKLMEKLETDKMVPTSVPPRQMLESSVAEDTYPNTLDQFNQSEQPQQNAEQPDASYQAFYSQFLNQLNQAK